VNWCSSFDNFAQTRDLWQNAPRAVPFQLQVATITDEDSFFYLPNSNEITRPSVTLMRRMFNTMGCPVGLYLMEDLCGTSHIAMGMRRFGNWTSVSCGGLQLSPEVIRLGFVSRRFPDYVPQTTSSISISLPERN